MINAFSFMFDVVYQGGINRISDSEAKSMAI